LESLFVSHGSGNPDAVCRYCEEFAAARDLAFHRDGADNVIIIKPAAPGYENAEPLILQGHLDMVCVKDPDCGIDFEKDGLDLAVEGDWVYARGTTLGGDDGIAVAMIMAILDAKDLKPPAWRPSLQRRIGGMLGASALDVVASARPAPAELDAGRMCSPWAAQAASWQIASSLSAAPRSVPFRLRSRSDWLAGATPAWKSPRDGFPNRLMGRLLDELRPGLPLRLTGHRGGLKDNAIPLMT
jgi:dipeptidase D